MPRRPTRRKVPRAPLTEPERHLLETGDPSMKPGRNPGWVRPFQLVSRAGRDELRALWFANRADILEEWERLGKAGFPWAVRQFE